MRDGGYFRPGMVFSSSIPKERLVILDDAVPPVLSDIGDDKHVGAVAIEIEPFRHVFAQHGGRKWPEALAELDLQIELPLHLGRARIAEDRSGAKRAGPNSMRPWNQPTAFSSARAPTVCSISTSSSTISNTAPGLAQADRQFRHSRKRDPDRRPACRQGHCRPDAADSEEFVIGRQSRAECTSGVTGGRLNPEFVESRHRAISCRWQHN